MTTATSPDRTAWREAIADIAEKAKQTLPECNGRVDKAVALVLNGDVELLPDGHAKVASQANGTLSYRIVNGACDCRDYAQAPSHWCKHRIAAGIQKRVEARLQATGPSAHDDLSAMPSQAPVEMPHGIDPRHIVLIQGKPFVKFAGLLELAHKRGLQELRVEWTYNDAELSLAHAHATFPFGVFAEWGDATR